MTVLTRTSHLHKASAAGFCVLLCILIAAIVLSCHNSITPVGIIIHHSALPTRRNQPADANLLDEIHRVRGYSAFYWGKTYHIGYHYVILPDGTVERGRPEHCRGAHAQGYNSYIGICLVGNFSEASGPGPDEVLEPTPAQLNALESLCEQLQDKYHFSNENILRHSDVNSKTECPGARLPFQKLIKRLSDRSSSDKR